MGDFFEEVAKAEKECVKEDEDEDELEEKREQTFVDDDGTTYDWSEEEKRYKPREMNEEGNDVAGEGFDVREMTFCPEDDSNEKVLPPPLFGFNEKKNTTNTTKSERKKPEIDIEAVKRKREQQQQNKSKKQKQKKTNRNSLPSGLNIS